MRCSYCVAIASVLFHYHYAKLLILETIQKLFKGYYCGDLAPIAL